MKTYTIGGTMQVKCTVTQQMVDDLKSYHSIDAEQELTAILKLQMIQERMLKRKKSIRKIFKS